MVPYRGCHFTLKLVCTVLIMVVTATCYQERQSVGSEMCKHHCGQFTWCTFCIFRIKRLACTATGAKHPPQTNGEEAVKLDFTKESLGSISERIELCEDRISKIVLTRSNGFRCIKLRTEENTQLLVAQDRTRTKTPIHVFNLLNNSITTYHHIKPQYVTAMAYVPTLRQVLMAVTLMKIQAFSLHTNVSVTLRRRTYVLSIAVDDVQQLVFLATRSPYMCVTRMTPDGRYFKNITCQFTSYILCLDTRREIMYFAGPRGICSFTYDGQGSQCINTPYQAPGLALGENGDVIYHIENSTVMEVNLFKNETGKKVGKVFFQVRCILFNKGYLYVSSRRNKYIYVWHDSNYSVLRGANPTGGTSQVIALMP